MEMKKVMILLVGLMMTLMYAGGYYPSYGPGNQWSPVVSTGNGFILVDAITIDGVDVVHGTADGTTGACPAEDCDMIGLMYGGQSIGWSYLPPDNADQVDANGDPDPDLRMTLVGQFKYSAGGVVGEGTEDYPSSADIYAPVVTMNFYDASTGQMYYNVASSPIVKDAITNFGSLNITGDGTECSTDGSTVSAPIEWCLGAGVCNNSSGGSAGDWDTFDAIGDGTDDCGYNGCTDTDAVNDHDGLGIDPVTEDGSCLYAGCQDELAANTHNDGYDCLGNPGDGNLDCCLYAVEGLDVLVDDYGNELTATWAGDDHYTCSVNGGDAVACSSPFVYYGDFNSDVTLVINADNGATDYDGVSVTTDVYILTPLGSMPGAEVESVTAAADGGGCLSVDYIAHFGYTAVTTSLQDHMNYDVVATSNDASPVSFCGLNAGESFTVTVTAVNDTDHDSMTANAQVLPYSEGQLAITSIEASTYSILVAFEAAENYGETPNWMYTACAGDICNSSPNTSISISGLSPTTDYNIDVTAESQYGHLSGGAASESSATTADPPAGEVWKFDITAEMSVLGQQYVSDMNNRIGFYYESSQAASDAGIAEPLPPASDGFDAYWDVPEMSIANPDNEIHFYVENNWDEETGWGRKWAYDVRALNDSHYATNNQTVFNGIVEAETGGLGTLTITPGGVTDGLLSSANTYVPVYALVNGGGHDGDYYKIERDVVTIPLTLQSNTPVSVDFIVGNLIPEAADGLSSTSDASSASAGADWKPGSDMSWLEDSSCDAVTLEGINYNDADGSSNYDLTRCNAFEQRYPASSYTTASSSDAGESGMGSGSHAAGNDSSLADDEDDLEFATEYTYTVTAHNGAGEGASISTSTTTTGNVDPSFNDLCTNDGTHNNDCASDISSSAVGHGSGPETEEGLVTDGSDDVYLYHTYTAAHDHIGRLSDGGTDADGLDQSGTPLTITLGSRYTDHEGYALDASWSGDLALTGASSFTGANDGDEGDDESTVSFTTTEPNSGTGSSYNFQVTVTDDNWLTGGDGENGSNSINTSITVTILPEPNQAPEADVSVPAGQDDEAGDGYWQVPHNGDNEYNCDDLIAYDDPGNDGCDDNRASITLSHAGSSDPDCTEAEGPLCEEHDFWWSEAVMGMSYNDLNNNGEYDAGEPCDDGCLWDFDENGIAPAVNDGPASHDENHEQRHDGGTGNIWTLTVQDNYGAENTAARGFYVLPEPNTRAYSTPATDATSSHKYDGEGGGDDDDVHYLPEGQDVNTVYINTGSVSDADGDNIIYTTTLNDELIIEASGDCDTTCNTGLFNRDLGPGEYTVTTCAQDSYEGYEYLMYASTENGTDDVDATVETTQNDPECTSFSFIIIDEPAAVDVTSLDFTDQGMSYISMSWDPSDHSINNITADELDELGENATHYVVERTTNPTDVSSWSRLTTLDVVREYGKRDCSGKEDVYDNYSDACEDPTMAQASDDGEWYYMGRGNDGSFHFLDEGLSASTAYSYRVFAVNSHGRSSGIGNVLTHSTEAKPEMSFDRTMSAEIYAAGDMTNTNTVYFTSADDSAGHNISSVTSSYTTYESTTDNALGFNSFTGDAGEHVDGPSDVDFSYAVSAWETDHGQSIEVCFEDAGDFWGYDKEGACASTDSFTGSQEFLHHPYTYNGWHVFGAPMYANGSSMDFLMSDGLPDYSAGSDYVWFTQAGGFGESHMYNFGQAYFLGLNHALVSFTMQGNILSSQDDSNLENDLSLSGHSLARGWNLVSPKLVRSVDVDMLTVVDGTQSYTWAEAQTLGLVSGEVLGTDEHTNFESDSFSPWTGYWIHASKSCELGVAPHSFDLAKEEVEVDHMVWNMNIEASPVNGDARGDIIKLGLSDIASNDIVNGEDTEDIPVMTMADSYLDLYMKDANGMRFWKNTKEMISPEQGQAWTINGYSANSLSDVKLEWTMDEIDAAYDITMFINGEVIDMRAETNIVVSTEALNSITVVVGSDPLASGLGTPAKFALNDAYPNPFNPVTSMQLSLAADGFTSVKVYNLMGQVVEVLHEGMLQAGYHQVSWNADVVPSGVYLVKVEQGTKIATQKVMLMK
jgi:hypothetical protein